MSSRSNLTACAGLETYGNELTRREGSLKIADNVNVDEKGVITPRRGLATYSNFTNDTESAEVDDRVKRRYCWRCWCA